MLVLNLSISNPNSTLKPGSIIVVKSLYIVAKNVYGWKYSRTDQIKFVKDSLWKIWRDMVCLRLLRLSSTDFIWSVLECLDPYTSFIRNGFRQLRRSVCRTLLKIGEEAFLRKQLTAFSRQNPMLRWRALEKGMI